jgi:hypothetical protein
VYGHALAAGDVADDLLAANRVAASGAKHHQIVDPVHRNLVIVGSAEYAANH